MCTPSALTVSLDRLPDERRVVPEEVDAVAPAVVEVGVPIEIPDPRPLGPLDDDRVAAAEPRVARLAARHRPRDLGERTGALRTTGSAHRRRNPSPSGSAGSSVNVAAPVRYALPSTSVISAGRPANVGVPHDASGELGADDREMSQQRSRGSRPSSSRSASRAEVPEPHGERSTSPSANTVTLRCVSGLSALLLPEDHAVDVAQLGLERMDEAHPLPRARASPGDRAR